MAFIDVATGKDENFVKEAGDALSGVGVTGQWCAFMGAVHIDRLTKVLAQQGVAYQRVGTKSLKLEVPVGPGRRQLYVQAVHDKYTKWWPMPWLIGADRKAYGGGFNGTSPDVVNILTQDLIACAFLYVPTGKKLPEDVAAGVAKEFFGQPYPVTFRHAGTMVHLESKDAFVGQTSVAHLHYPFKHRHLVGGPTGVYVDEAKDEEVVLEKPDTSREAMKRLKAAAAEPTLEDIMRARKSKARKE